MTMFVWGRFRYDLVAIAALMAAVLSGVVPADEAYMGFGHPAVITVAAVLIISRALQNSGLVEYLVQFLAPARRSTASQVAAGGVLVALLSTIMNNVGALALMLPVGLRNAIKSGRSPSLVLMPLSFASLLGGLVTLIGTPPNIVISSFREESSGTPFSMFDFTPVGLTLAVVGLVYLTTAGWRLLPERIPAVDQNERLVHVATYSIETNIPADSPLVGKQVRELEGMCDQEVSILAIIRNGNRHLGPRAIERLRSGDIVILQGDPSVIQPLADGIRLGPLGHQIEKDQEIKSEDVTIVEVVLMPHSPIDGKSMRGVRLHDRYGINLLAVSRQGRPATARLKNTTFKTGDVLLLQGEARTMDQTLETLGCLPLADRGLTPQKPGSRMLLPVAIFAAAIAAAAVGWVTVPIAFTCAVVLLIATSTVSLSEAYDSIEWPIILLLAGLIPLGEALQHTGGTDLIAQLLLDSTSGSPMWLILALLLAVSMWLSDLVHNTPTAILVAPLAISIAEELNSNPDAFLMAVAVGAASPYLTPIGHQSNTLVMAPGGYTFADYGRLGLPLQVLILLFGVPAIMIFWPLT
ncbi:MAG: SLC13 family permease [Rhizobiales bacterium]|nr:SLC13 family permease [Hyphomicrobiales bacterium]